MTATLEQTRADLLRLIDLALRGEEVLITREGQTVARLTGVPQPRATEVPTPGTAADRRVWLDKLARLRAATATGKTSPTTEQILDDLRAERG